MKTLGIIGGIGPESTIEYYRRIMAACRARSPQVPAPSILINSIDNAKVLNLVAEGELRALVGYLWAELQRLDRAGAGFALIAANTPHVVFDDLVQVSSLPLLDIVTAVRAAAQARGLRRLALIGTRFTMQGSFYPKKFATAGIELVLPNEAEQAYIHEKYLGELLRGVTLDETRQGLVAIFEAMRQRSGIDGVILGGTELSLILREPTAAGLPLLDTTEIHVAAAVEQLLAQ
ncbi:MAG: amino acid racemase [Chthoniobacterales bacterium]